MTRDKRRSWWLVTRSARLISNRNDIGWPGGVLSPSDPPVSAEDLIMGYRQLIAQAQVHNIRVIGVTLTPFVNAGVKIR
jgi:hypothetical protein